MGPRTNTSSLMTAVAFVAASAAWETAPRAQALAFVEAAGRGSPAHPKVAALLDHNPDTVFCAPASGPKAAVTFAFKAKQRVNRIVVSPAAAGAGQGLESVRLSDGEKSVVIALDSGSNKVDLDLKDALQGEVYTLTFERSVGNASKACLADVSLYNDAEDVLSLDASRASTAASILGSWRAGPIGASESTLTFAADGSWSWVHEPREGGARRTLQGTFVVKGDTVMMRQGSSGLFTRVAFARKHVTVDPTDVGAPASDYDALTLQGQFLPELNGPYDNAHFE